MSDKSIPGIHVVYVASFSFPVGHAIGYAAYHVTFTLSGSTTTSGILEVTTCSSETMFPTSKGSGKTWSERTVSTGGGEGRGGEGRGGEGGSLAFTTSQSPCKVTGFRRDFEVFVLAVTQRTRNCNLVW